MVGALEDHDPLASRVGPRQLHCGLHRLGPGVDQQGLLAEVPGRHLVEELRDLHVGFVGRDDGAGVDEPAGLVAKRRHHPLPVVEEPIVEVGSAAGRGRTGR